MLILTETPAGYGLFEIKDSKLLKADADTINAAFSTPAGAQAAAQMKAFCKFEDTKMAMDEATALIESTMGKQLKKFLKKNIVDQGITDELAVLDRNLGSLIVEKLGIQVAYSEQVKELSRALRFNIHELVAELDPKASETMALSLAHSLSRFKLKFSPDKVDTMIIAAIGLLDDLDKEVNTFAMKLREWYGWHFPEMAKIVTDHLVYGKCIKLMGMKTNCKNTDFSKIGVPEEIEAELKQAAEISSGPEITDEDMQNILVLAERVTELLEYRVALADYLKARMSAIAPNLNYMVGHLVGARLISKAGSLMNLAKQPASTLQILGAEKALFRALKTKTSTPKYGMIYHASAVGQASSKFKGKIARVLAAKMSLSARVDALGDDAEPTVAKEFKDYVEARLAVLEEGNTIDASRKHLKKANLIAKAATASSETKSGSNTYNQEADAVTTVAASTEEADGEKKKKKKKRARDEDAGAAADEEPAAKKTKEEEGEKNKKKKKKAAEEEA